MHRERISFTSEHKQLYIYNFCVCLLVWRITLWHPIPRFVGWSLMPACLPANCFSFLLPTQDVVASSCALFKEMVNAMHQPFMRTVIRNMEVHHRIHNSPPFDCIIHPLNLVTPLHSTASATIWILPNHLPLGFPSGMVTQFSYQNSVPIYHLSRASFKGSVPSAFWEMLNRASLRASLKMAM
jgi:hypothetical protein